MSKRNVSTARKGAIPRSGGIPRKPSSTCKGQQAQPFPVPPKEKEFTLPAYSLLPKKKKEQAFEDLEKWKKKTIRRNAPQGEDLKKIRETIRGIKNQDVTVQEFVGLVAPYTGDNGQVLRNVMAEDLAGFRKLARKVYETMAQDVGDVLANEHIQLTQFHQERTQHFNDKMMGDVNEILEMNPDFDFDKYHAMGEAYLDSAFPITPEVVRDEQDIEMQARQMAYHRLQWLRSEGERLHEENRRLKQRLGELKHLQQQEQEQALMAEQMAEQKKALLEQEQSQMEDKLEELSRSLEHSMVHHESLLRKEGDKRQPGVVRKALKEKRKTKKATRPGPQNEDWSAVTAVDIEGELTKETIQADVSQLTMQTPRVSPDAPPCSRPPPKVKPKRSKSKFAKAPRARGESDAFHYSPIKTPPRPSEAPRQTSPFHYSPQRSPPREQSRAEASGAGTCGPCAAEEEKPQERTTREISTSRITQRRSPPGQQQEQRFGRRQAQAPRDQWGGYY